jgi:hypothetical protein
VDAVQYRVGGIVPILGKGYEVAEVEERHGGQAVMTIRRTTCEIEGDGDGSLRLKVFTVPIKSPSRLEARSPWYPRDPEDRRAASRLTDKYLPSHKDGRRSPWKAH